MMSIPFQEDRCGHTKSHTLSLTFHLFYRHNVHHLFRWGLNGDNLALVILDGDAAALDEVGHHQSFKLVSHKAGLHLLPT